MLPALGGMCVYLSIYRLIFVDLGQANQPNPDST